MSKKEKNPKLSVFSEDYTNQEKTPIDTDSLRQLHTWLSGYHIGTGRNAAFGEYHLREFLRAINEVRKNQK